MSEGRGLPAKRSAAIVGGGIVGLCLAEALSRRGVSMWCFEQGTCGGGQSGGATRIFRHRHDDPRLVRLALRARSSWADLEGRLEEQLVGKEGVLILSDADEAARLRPLGVAAEELPWEAASSMMSLGRPPDRPPRAALEKDGGAIRARVAIERLQAALHHSLVKAEVQGFEHDSSDVTVFASDGIYKADQVFVTAGAGTARLARAGGIEIPESRACHLRLTFESKASEPLPCLLDRSGRFGEVAYGSPSPDGQGYAIGISSDDGSVGTTDSEAPDPAELVRIRSRIEAYAAQLLPATLGPVTGARLCLATPLRSGDDDFHAWRRGRATYFAGHNLFKFAPLIGALLAESIEAQDLPSELQLAEPQV